MRASLARLWPGSLAGRLVILLVAALALAQLGLTLILRMQQDALLDGVIHGQALNQTVALARLLTDYPAADGDRIARAFGSRGSCASVARRSAISRGCCARCCMASSPGRRSSRSSRSDRTGIPARQAVPDRRQARLPWIAVRRRRMASVPAGRAASPPSR